MNGRPAPGLTQVVLTVGGGGLEAVAARLAIAVAHRGLPSRIVALDAGGEHEPALRAAGVKLEIVGGRRLAGPRFHYRLARALRGPASAVVHTHHFAPLLHCAMVRRVAGIPRIVHTEHAHDYLVGRRDYIRTLRLLSRRCGAFVVVGERMVSYYADVVGVDRARLRVIPNGVDLAAFAPEQEKEARRQALSLPSGLLIGAVGRLAPEKNVPLLLRSFAALLTRRLDSSLLLIGDGPDRAVLEELAGTLGISQRVAFLGWRSDVRSLLACLDIYALSSTNEGLPLAVLEAMACATAVVVTTVGDLGEVVEHGRSGILVPSDNLAAFVTGLEQLASDPMLRTNLGREARLRVLQRYSQEAMVDRYLTCYGFGIPPRPAAPAAGAMSDVFPH